MAVLAVVNKEAWDKLPEAVREHYVERKEGDLAGHYVLDVTPSEVQAGANKDKRMVMALEDVHGLKSALQKERTTAAEFDKKFKAFEGLDPEEARKAVAKIKEFGDNPPDSEKHRADKESLKKQLEDKYNGEVAKFQGTIKDLETQLSSTLIDQQLSTALDKHALIENGKKLMLPHLKSQVKVIRTEDGKFTARVVDETGAERVSLKSGNNGPMDIDELVEGIAKDPSFKPLFKAKEASGTAGAQPNANQQSNTSPFRKDQSGTQTQNGRPTPDFVRPEQRLMAIREQAASG